MSVDVSRIPTGPERVNELSGSGGKMDRTARRELARRRKGKKGDGEPDADDLMDETDRTESSDPAGETRGRNVDRRA